MIQLSTPKTRDRKTFTIGELKGIDAWNNPLSVSSDRAVNMKNIINRNGLNHKRHGWAQEGDSFSEAIDGYYRGFFHSKKWEIIYAGNKFYVRVDGTISGNAYYNSRLKAAPAKFYEHDGKVYIVGCGDYLVFVPNRYGTFSFEPVADSKYAYVPLTFISDYYGSTRGLSVIAVEKSNMLSSARLNKFYDADCEGDKKDYRLDVYTDEPSVTPVIKDVMGTEISWISPDSGEKKFDIIENGEAYRLIIQDDSPKSNNGWYVFTYKGTKYYLQAKSTDTIRTKILLTLRGEGLLYTARNIYKSKTVSSDPEYKCELAKTGCISSFVPFGMDVSGYKIKFSGTGQCGTLKGHTEWKYKDNSGNIKSIYWVAATGDWDQCYLTDGEYTYAMATRSSFLVQYTFYAGQDAADKYPDGFSGESHTYASQFVFPEGSTFLYNGARFDGEKIYDPYGEIYEAPYCHGFTLAYTADSGSVKHIGTICPYAGEISVFRYISESWDGIGDEKVPTISVKYKTQYSDAEKIAGCTVSTLFGLNGNSDRLFVGGNPEMPNVDWHSGYTDKDGKGGNFGYFPSDSSATLGSASSWIKGYQRLSDGTLAVYKEKSNKEATLYLRSGVSETDSAGRIKEYYPNNGGYLTEGAVNSECFGVLGADMLMLSENGVYGLEISENIASQQRFLKERSKPVNPLLTAHSSLAYARAVVFDNKYFLAVDGKVYIADGRYTRKESGDMGDTFSYEWYVWDNCPVRTWIIDGNRLGFGTNDGRICFFGETYTDSYFVNIRYPDFGFNRDNFGMSGFVINENITCPPSVIVDEKEYNRARFRNVLGGILGRWTFYFSDYEGVITFAESSASSRERAELYLRELLKEGDYLYFTSDYDGTCIGKRKVLSVDYDTIEIHVEHVSGEKWMVAATGEKYTETQKPPHVDFLLVDIGESYICPRKNAYGSFFYVSKLIGALSFTGVWFNNEELSKAKPDISLVIYGDVPVTALWQTGALNFGTNFYVKQLESVSTLTEGRMKISFETRTDNGYSIDIANADKPFDFGNLNFGEISFSNLMDDTSGASLCTRSVKKTFGTLVLRIENSDEDDFVIHEITLIYKLLRRLKGVR